MKVVNDLNSVMENFILMASPIITSCNDNLPWYDIIIIIIIFVLSYHLFCYTVFTI